MNINFSERTRFKNKYKFSTQKKNSFSNNFDNSDGLNNI